MKYLTVVHLARSVSALRFTDTFTKCYPFVGSEKEVY